MYVRLCYKRCGKDFIMVEAVRPVGVTNDNYGTKALKYGTIAGAVGATVGAGAGALWLPHINLENNLLTDEFVKQAGGNLFENQVERHTVYYKELEQLAKTGKFSELSELTQQRLKSSSVWNSWNFDAKNLEECKSLAKAEIDNILLESGADNLDDAIKTLSEDLRNYKNFFKLNINKNTTEETLLAAIKKHADLFGISAKNGQSLDDAVKEYLKASGGKDEFINLYENTINDMRKKLSASFDPKTGLLKEIPSNCSSESKSTFKILKETIANMKLKTAGKWALCTGAALGTIGLAIGACNKKEPPKASPKSFETIA